MQERIKGIYYARLIIIGSFGIDASPTTVGDMMPKAFQCISLSESEKLKDLISNDNTTSRRLEIFSKIDDRNEFRPYSFPVVRI